MPEPVVLLMDEGSLVPVIHQPVSQFSTGPVGGVYLSVYRRNGRLPKTWPTKCSGERGVMFLHAGILRGMDECEECLAA